MSLLVARRSPPESKIALFRSLFRGREDVYPRRFESRRTGKAGYQPACAIEWTPGLCEKPRIKCSQCLNQRFLPVTDDVVRWHLAGKDDLDRDFVMGAYPLLRDEMCFLLAADLDQEKWQDDALAILETCRQWDVPVALERSRSGNGGHLWWFFEQAIPATLARKFGSAILTATMNHRPDIGLESYDRLFPNQDTLPQGGFGNLIALPLQKAARQCGNSEFLDENLIPHADQWEYLSSVRKLERSFVEQLVSDADRRGQVIGVRLAPDEDDAMPWLSAPSRRFKEQPLQGLAPKELVLILGDQIYLAKADLPAELRNRLIRLAAFQNPEFYQAQAMRLPTYGKPRIIGCTEDHSQHLGLPRGCQEEVVRLLGDLGIRVTVRDERNPGKPLEVEFQGELRPDQMSAAKALLAHDTGVLSATTAFGKTVVASWLIAQRRVSTLVLVHRGQLLEQWVERLSQFLGIPAKSIGRFGGGRKRPTGLIDVALVQSLVHRGGVNDLVAEYGHVIVDECHHLSASSFEQVACRAKARYFTGLSATIARKDGRHPIIFMQCGPVRHKVDARAAALDHPFAHTVHVQPTDFRPLAALSDDLRLQFQQLYTELFTDSLRNRTICRDVREALTERRNPLVLTERNDHLELLAEELSKDIPNVIRMRGGMKKKEIRAIAERLQAIPESEPRVLVATGRYIGEGFDDPRLDTLFLTLPVSWRGTIAQYVGRLHRLHHGKREVRVYDYADLNVPMLSRMFDRRCRGYEAVGYSILLPGSAVPGWPADVPLPVDPRWKADYAASVRRLVRDGVDAPLAHLFVVAADSHAPAASDVSRARSATEAFLNRRLLTLPQTVGRFQLNGELPIPFNGNGQMEVDFLFKSDRVAVEIDGLQHLESVEAYRNDRRKDLLLQEHGYLVLRFLAQDVGKCLDLVLDTILRALAHRAATTQALTCR